MDATLIAPVYTTIYHMVVLIVPHLSQTSYWHPLNNYHQSSVKFQNFKKKLHGIIIILFFTFKLKINALLQ